MTEIAIVLKPDSPSRKFILFLISLPNAITYFSLEHFLCYIRSCICLYMDLSIFKFFIQVSFYPFQLQNLLKIIFLPIIKLKEISDRGELSRSKKVITQSILGT